MLGKLFRLVLLISLVIGAAATAQPARAEGEPPAVTPDAPTEVVWPEPPAPGFVLDPSQAITGTLKNAPENWESMTFDVAPIPDAAVANERIMVNSTADLADSAPADGICQASNGACTLRAAIDTANADDDTDEIIIPAGIYMLNTELKLIKQVTLTGAGIDSTIIDGSSKTRVFINYVANLKVQSTISNTIQNLTIRNGWNSKTAIKDRDGGGVYNMGILTLRNVKITNCKANEGGGINNSYDYLEPNKPALFLDNVTLDGNTATSSEMGKGGGGMFNGSRLNGVNVTITNNVANVLGGGFYNNSYHHEIILRNFVISKNKAKFGAGVLSDLTDYEAGYGVTLEDGEISNNTVQCCFYSTQGPAGGAIDNNEAIMRLKNVAIFGNYAPNGSSSSQTGYGGAIVNLRYMDLQNVSIFNNKAFYGAGIYNGNYNNWGNQLTMVNVTISGNQTTNLAPGSSGGAIFNVGVGRISMTNSTITQNKADATGGVRIFGGYMDMRNTILAGNSDNNAAPDCSGSFTSLGNNIVGDADGNAKVSLACKFTAKSTDQLNLVPGLAPLMQSDYVYYHPLTYASQAIDRGTNTNCPVTDVKGDPRPQGASCDVGADEFDPNITWRFTFIPIVRK